MMRNLFEINQNSSNIAVIESLLKVNKNIKYEYSMTEMQKIIIMIIKIKVTICNLYNNLSFFLSVFLTSRSVFFLFLFVFFSFTTH